MNKFRELRKEKNLTQFELAHQLNIDQTTISKWELDKALPDTAMLIKLAEFFDVSTDYLLSRSEYYYPDKISNNAKIDGAILKSLGETLKEHRILRNLSLKEIENKTGINNGSLSRWERNEVLPSIDACIRLDEFYGISVDELLGISNDDFGIRSAAPMSDSLTSEERELLNLFRELSPYLKGMTLNAVRSWANSDSDDARKKV